MAKTRRERFAGEFLGVLRAKAEAGFTGVVEASVTLQAGELRQFAIGDREAWPLPDGGSGDSIAAGDLVASAAARLAALREGQHWGKVRAQATFHRGAIVAGEVGSQVSLRLCAA